MSNSGKRALRTHCNHIQILKRTLKYTNVDTKTHVLIQAQNPTTLLDASFLIWPSNIAPNWAIKILFVLRSLVSLLLIEQP